MTWANYLQEKQLMLISKLKHLNNKNKEVILNKHKLLALMKVQIGQTIIALCKSGRWAWPADVKEISHRHKTVRCLVRVRNEIFQHFDFNAITGKCVDSSIDLLLVNHDFPKEKMDREDEKNFVNALTNKIKWIKKGNSDASFWTFNDGNRLSSRTRKNLGLSDSLDPQEQ